MLDFVLGIGLAALAVRGWLRGFVRELLDLVGLVVGAAIAFRMSAPLGGFLSDRFGASPEWGRIGAGIVLFILFGASMTVLAHFLSRVARLPGLTLVNRLLGAGVAAAWGILLVLVAVSVLAVLPVPDSVDEAVDGSTVISALAGPDALPRRLVEPLVGDEAITALGAIERITGGRRIVPAEGETVETEPVRSSDMAKNPKAVAFVADRVNDDRLESGVDPMTWSDALGAVAEARALEMYSNGFVARRLPTDVLEATAEQGLRLERAAEMASLASSERAAHAGISEVEGSALPDPGFDRFGVAVVTGPLGTLVVEVYGR